jgi:ABC-type polysaccharide/polyol phosphate export permease
MGAISAGLWSRTARTRDLLTVLARSDLRVRYGRGNLRFVKWVLDPISALGVYLLFVILVIDEGTTATGLSLACAIVPFQLLLSTAVNGIAAVQLRRPIILNMRFPRMLLPLASLATESIAFVATLLILPMLMVFYWVGPTLAILWVLPALAATAVLALALAYPATLFGIWYPELGPIAISVGRAAFFIAPGLVALDQITGTTRELLPINPLTGLFETYRDALLYGQSPAAWQLLVPLGAAALLFALFLPVYRSEQARLAKLVG